MRLKKLKNWKLRESSLKAFNKQDIKKKLSAGILQKVPLYSTLNPFHLLYFHFTPLFVFIEC